MESQRVRKSDEVSTASERADWQGKASDMGAARRTIGAFGIMKGGGGGVVTPANLLGRPRDHV